MKKQRVHLMAIFLLISLISACTQENKNNQTTTFTNQTQLNLQQTSTLQTTTTTSTTLQTQEPEKQAGTPGKPCTTEKDCYPGLICLKQKCAIPTPENLAQQNNCTLDSLNQTENINQNTTLNPKNKTQTKNQLPSDNQTGNTLTFYVT